MAPRSNRLIWSWLIALFTRDRKTKNHVNRYQSVPKYEKHVHNNIQWKRSLYLGTEWCTPVILQLLTSPVRKWRPLFIQTAVPFWVQTTQKSNKSVPHIETAALKGPTSRNVRPLLLLGNGSFAGSWTRSWAVLKFDHLLPFFPAVSYFSILPSECPRSALAGKGDPVPARGGRGFDGFRPQEGLRLWGACRDARGICVCVCVFFFLSIE